MLEQRDSGAYKTQPKHVNPDLWERFLIKKGYSGRIFAQGVWIKVLVTPYGILKLVESEALIKMQDEADLANYGFIWRW